MASKRKPTSATARLKQDYIRLKKDPVPYVIAEPLQSNILEWHYVVNGPENSPYEGGIYHGKLVFPREFPFKPPAIYMLTPNGRFRINTRLCLSNSDFHPDSWNPAWSVSTILTGLLSFMLEKSPTYGSIETSDNEKRQLAYKSLAFNLGDQQFVQQFPEYAEEMQKALDLRLRNNVTSNSATSNSGSSNPNLNPLLGGAGVVAGAAIGPGGVAGGGAIANIVVALAVAVFVYAVKYVVSSTMTHDNGI